MRGPRAVGRRQPETVTMYHFPVRVGLETSAVDFFIGADVAEQAIGVAAGVGLARRPNNLVDGKPDGTGDVLPQLQRRRATEACQIVAEPQ